MRATLPARRWWVYRSTIPPSTGTIHRRLPGAILCSLCTWYQSAGPGSPRQRHRHAISGRSRHDSLVGYARRCEQYHQQCGRKRTRCRSRFECRRPHTGYQQCVAALRLNHMDGRLCSRNNPDRDGRQKRHYPQFRNSADHQTRLQLPATALTQPFRQAGKQLPRLAAQQAIALDPCANNATKSCCATGLR